MSPLHRGTIATLFLTLSMVYPWCMVVVGYGLPVELVELCVYSSVAVMAVKSREDSSVTVLHMSVLMDWVDDMKQRPDVNYINIVKVSCTI